MVPPLSKSDLENIRKNYAKRKRYDLKTGRVFHVRLATGHIAILWTFIPPITTDPEQIEWEYPTEMGMQFITHTSWRSTDCNTVQLENGFVVTTTEVKQDDVLRMDHDIIADHYGNRIYQDGKNIDPVAGHVNIMT